MNYGFQFAYVQEETYTHTLTHTITYTHTTLTHTLTYKDFKNTI